MVMEIIKVAEDNKEKLYDYAACHGAEHDSSYLPGRDFDFSAEYPSYLLMENNEVIGAVCLMRTKRFLSSYKARFSIFHAVQSSTEPYAMLLKAIQPHIQDLRSVFLFIPEEKENTAVILKGLGFGIERYSFILESRDPPQIAPVFPEGISVQPLDPADLEGIAQFADCINQEFKGLAGHTPSAVEDIQTWFEDQSYLEGGLCLLKKGQEPIGTIGLMRDLDDMDAGEIGAFGILREYRGLNLGRNLLRYGIQFLVRKGFNPLVLSVNGENRGAIKLYESEGFLLTDSVVCYRLEREKNDKA